MNDRKWNRWLVALACVGMVFAGLVAGAYVSVLFRSPRFELHRGVFRLDKYSGAVDILQGGTWRRVGEEEESDQIAQLSAKIGDLEQQIGQERGARQQLRQELERKASELAEAQARAWNLSSDVRSLARKRAQAEAALLARGGSDKAAIFSELVQCCPLSDSELRSIAVLAAGLSTPWCVSVTDDDRPRWVSIEPAEHVGGKKVGCGRTQRELDAITDEYRRTLPQTGGVIDDIGFTARRAQLASAPPPPGDERSAPLPSPLAAAPRRIGRLIDDEGLFTTPPPTSSQGGLLIVDDRKLLEAAGAMFEGK